MKSPSFWILATALLCVCRAGYAPARWQLNGFSSTQASSWDALYLVLSGAVLLIVGKITAKFSPSVFAVIVCAAFIACAACMVLLASSPTVMMMVLIVVFGAVSYPLSASIPGLMGQSIFGMKDFAEISATLMTAMYCGQALYAPIMAGFLTSEGGMRAGWIFFGGAVAAGMILILAAIALSPMRKANSARYDLN